MPKNDLTGKEAGLADQRALAGACEVMQGKN